MGRPVTGCVFSDWPRGRQRSVSWAQDSTGRNYISGVTTTLDYGASAQVQTRTEQTLDAHGNVTQSKVYDYGSPLPSTAARTYNGT